MKLGTQVEFVQPRVTGEVVNAVWNTEKNELECLVQISEDQQRWFLASQLSVVEAV